MKIVKTKIQDVVELVPDVHRDRRGYFAEVYRRSELPVAIGDAVCVVQSNASVSMKGVLRGMHGMFRGSQGKLVGCPFGEVLDVAVDLRPGSPTYGLHHSVTLDGREMRQVYVPPGFAHGFLALSEVAVVTYSCTRYWRGEHDFTIVWNDPALGIAWPVDEPLLSAKDQAAPLWAEAMQAADR